MPVCRKNRILIAALLIMLLWGGTVYAKDRYVKIKQAQLTLNQNKATLTADLDFHLSKAAREALHSGITLYWDVSVDLKQSMWNGLWYKTLFSQSYRYSLTYYTILNNYRLKDEQADLFWRFSNLSEALANMRYLVYVDMPLQPDSENQCVITVLKVKFDTEALPVPLRPFAYFDKQWDLSASERRWCE